MLVFVVIVHIYFKTNLLFSFKAKSGLQRQHFCQQNSSHKSHCYSLRGVRLRTVLVNAVESDFVLC